MNDDLLRAKGYRIHSRPQGEPLWELPGIAVLPESQAVASVQTWEREHRPEHAPIRSANNFENAIVGLAIAIAVVTMLALAAAMANASPDRPGKSPSPKRPEIPALAMERQYGTITQQGRALQIEGEHWKAIGTIRDDGTIFLLWTEVRTGNVAPSLYKMEGGIPVGEWGFAPAAIFADGKLEGDLRPDRIIRKHPSPPPDY